MVEGPVRVDKSTLVRLVFLTRFGLTMKLDRTLVGLMAWLTTIETQLVVDSAFSLLWGEGRELFS